MDNRSALRFKNPLPTHRAVSGSYPLQHHQSLRHGQPPSRLSNVRSASQPVPPACIANKAPVNEVKSTAAYACSGDKFRASPDAIKREDASEEDDNTEKRPTKRVKVEGDSFQGHSSASDIPSLPSLETTVDAAHQTLPGSPLPSLPKQRVLATRSTPSQHDSRSRQGQAARKANGLDPPAIATRFPQPKHVADFSPWNGHHPEDGLSELVIQNGYFDKLPSSTSTECSSAKPTIWPNLSQKNNMGLQTLSYLFTTVMEKRSAMGKCNAQSTFKPPPRVTVTDTKREAWLRDLANLDVPLRKQSRTIPHGIRGKLLMEQCLSKGISMPRAVWLAKCVGANELRAFRRKGVSGAAAATGESKWIREWTIHVEQFLEGIIALCGQAEWQTKMDYAVKLATSFYSERLLDRDHYLDWIVSSFAESGMNRLPIWILLIQLYWKDITSFTKRGRRLAEATLEYLHKIAHQSTQVNTALKARLQKLLVILSITNRGCLILPRTWEKYKYILAPGAPAVNFFSTRESYAHNITRRNERLIGPLFKTPQNTRSPLLRLYSMLDTITVDVNTSKILSAARAIIVEPANLVRALLDWAASSYRIGLSRIYLVSRLLMQLRTDGQNTDDAILNYLGNKTSTDINTNNIHKLIVELVSADAFSPSRYMQWLITSGFLSSGNKCGLATGLLTALPVNDLPLHLQNTQQMLMRRLGYALDQELTTSNIEFEILEAVSRPEAATSSCLDRFNALNGSAQSSISGRVITKVKEWTKVRRLSLQTFCILRQMTEKPNNVLALSDLIEITLLTEDPIVLATIIDTIDVYAQCFAAVGRLPALTNLAIERYRVLRAQQLIDRTVILALKSHLTRLNSQTALTKLLENDLAICHQQSSMAVCSPASDNLVNMQASNLDSDDDLDAVFASGNTMDEQLMQRVFARVVHRASKPSPPAVRAPSRLCAWWNQLRTVDASGFEQLVRKHLRSCLEESNNIAAFSNLVSTLIASTCVAFKTVLQVAKESQLPHAAFAALTTILSKSAVNQSLHDSEVFRCRAQQKRCQVECIDQIASLLTTAMDNPSLPTQLPVVSNLLRRYLTKGNKSILKDILGAEKPSPVNLRNCSQLVADLLCLDKSEGAINRSIDATVIIDLANPLSVDYCAIALQYYSKIGSFNSSEDKNELQNAILEAIARGCQVWPQLLEGAGSGVMATVYQWSRDKVLAATLSQGAEEPVNDEEMHRQLEVLDITYHAAKEDNYSQIIAALTEKIKSLESQLSAGIETSQAFSNEVFMQSLAVTLHLSILYSTSSGSESEASRSNQGQLLAALCNLIVHPALQRHTSTLEYIYDITASLADNLPDPVLNSIVKTLPNSCRDGRVASILGDSPSSDAWLALVSQVPLPGSQQQRILAKQTASTASVTATQSPQTPIPARQPPSAAALQKTGNLRATPNSVATPDSMTKTTPFPLRRWEIMSDATPIVGENDTSLSLGLFGARKV